MRGYIVCPRFVALILAAALPLAACAAAPTNEDPAPTAGQVGAAGQGGAGAGGVGGAGQGGAGTGGAEQAGAGTGGEEAGGSGGEGLSGQGGEPAGGSSGSSGSSGQAGASPLPTGPVLPAGPCADSIESVYQTPAGLPPLADEGRGEVIRCGHDATLDMAEVSQQLAGKKLSDVPVSTGLDLVRIAYRTRRADGVDGVSTARVYLPTTPRPAPWPLIVIAHPSEGLADNCAPSKNASSLQDLALPWAARGYAVIATDYAGLGNEGTQGYLDNHDQAYSVLDSARALRKLLPAGWLSSKAVIFGYSQGGGAALAAQGLASSYGLDADLAAVAVFAPEWPSRLDSFGFVKVLRAPDTLTILSGITKAVVVPSLVYAYGRNHAPDALPSLFPPGKESGLGTAEESMCLQPFGAYIQTVALHQRDLVSDDLRTSFLACVDGQEGCVAPGKGLYDHMKANLVAPDPKGAPVLYAQGLLDTIMPPAEEAACNLALLKSAGVDTTLCTDKTGLHSNAVVDAVVFAMKWTEAVVGDLARPTCDGGGLPACLP